MMKVKQVMLVQDEANKKSNLIFIFLLLSVILISQVISAADTYPVTVRPKTGGALQPNNYFEYVFNFTTDSACTSVLSSKSAGITTDAYGIGATELDLSGLTQSPSYLCEYRNTSLRKVHNISLGMFDNVFGSGVNLTENLTVDINTFFVNSANNRVGIGTTSPKSIFHTKTNLSNNRFIIQSGGSNEAIFDLVSGGTGTRFFYRDSDNTFGIWYNAIWNESTGALSGGTTKFRMQSDGDIVLNEGGGKVGVGTTTPDGLVHLETSGLDATDTADVGQYALIIHDKNGANDKEVGIGFSMFPGGAVVDATDAPGAAITHERTGSWSVGKLHFKTRNSISESGNPVTRMTIDENGRVGIGTTAPSSKLEVEGSVNFNNSLYVNSSNGYVGIGTSNPTEKLDVRNGTIRVGYDADTFDQLIEFYRNNIKIGVIDNDGSDIRLRAQNGNDVKIGDDAGTKLIVKDGGNVGIGTIGPDSSLEVINGTTNGGFMVSSAAEANGDLFIVDEGGNVGIGTSSPAAPLHVNLSGNGTVLRLEDSDGICNHNPETGSETVSCSSDEKLKEDIRNASSVLEEFEEIQVRDYVVKESGKDTTGVIAQEIQETHPEMVHEEDGMLFVEQPNPWKLLKAIQELQIKIEALTNGFVQLIDAVFKGHVTFGKDNVGQAVILEGSTEVNIEFEREYDNIPIITITPIGLYDIDYGITDISSSKFKIIIDSPQSEDITFNWHAFGGEQNIAVSIEEQNNEHITENIINNTLDESIVTNTTSQNESSNKSTMNNTPTFVGEEQNNENITDNFVKKNGGNDSWTS